jgi:hypothetical protein
MPRKDSAEKAVRGPGISVEDRYRSQGAVNIPLCLQPRWDTGAACGSKAVALHLTLLKTA